MNKHIPLSICFYLALLASSCGPSLKVSTDYDKAVNFQQYKTFGLYKADAGNAAISQLNQQRIINAIVGEMAKKGFTQTDNNPDLLVNPVTILKDKVAVSANTNYYGYGGVYRPYYWGGGMGASSTTSYDVQHYKDGSLIIDVIDAGTKKLLWQGIGDSEIDGPLKEPDTQIPQAITKIMQGFPPGAAKQ